MKINFLNKKRTIAFSLYNILILLALIILPLLGFIFGVQYQEKKSPSQEMSSIPAVKSEWKIAVDSAPWIPSYSNHSFTFDGSLWLFGGWGDLGGGQKGIWRSDDGIDWKLVSSLNEDWSRGLINYSSLVFDEKIWIMGGYSPQFQGGNGHIWVSEDGISWKSVEQNDWSGRTDFSLISFNNKMWIMGGHNNSEYYLNDVWSSSDGISWKKEVVDAPWKERTGHIVVVYNDKLWLMGGLNKYDSLNDVWMSEDGKKWEVVTESAPWSGRSRHTAVVTPKGMYILGGRGYKDRFNDVWFSKDGLHWEKETTSWSVRSGHVSAYFAGKMWVMNGSGENNIYNDIWNREE